MKIRDILADAIERMDQYVVDPMYAPIRSRIDQVRDDMAALRDDLDELLDPLDAEQPQSRTP